MRRLLIRPGAIGDCITCFPAMEHLRARYTEVWLPSALAPLVQFADLVRPLPSTGIDFLGLPDCEPPAALVESLRAFDSIVTWYGAERSEFRAALLRINPDCRFLPALPPSGSTEHATDFFAAQVRAPLGSMPRIDAGPCDPRDSVVIHPFSGSVRKNWPLARFQELARRLPCPVEWAAGPEEMLPDAVCFENLLDLARWIRGARLYIGNDSGITHLAAATGAATAALFGASDARVWAPRGPRVLLVERQPFSALPVEEVCAALSRWTECW